MTSLQIKLPPAFHHLVEAMNSGKYNVFLVEGGARSAKTWTIIQLLQTLAWNNNYRISCFRKKSTWTRDTIYHDFHKVLQFLDLEKYAKHNKTLMTYHIGKSFFEFGGLDDPQRVHSRTQDVVWCNEAIEMTRDNFDQLEQRTNKFMILDYNPSEEEHWIYNLKKRDDVYYHHSTMLDNPFLPQKLIDKLKSYEPNAKNALAGTVDKYNWDVYGLGKPARREGRIFNNVEIVPSVPENAKLLAHGLDWGYSNDPTAIEGVYQVDEKTVCVDEILYKTGMLNRNVAQAMSDADILSTDEIIADNAEPKSIEELYQAGWNIHACDKGPDSVLFGIDLMKGYKIQITERSLNIIKEFNNYIWKQDKEGKSLNVPIDDYNHAIDGIRYVMSKKLKTERELKVTLL